MGPDAVRMVLRQLESASLPHGAGPAFRLDIIWGVPQSGTRCCGSASETKLGHLGLGAGGRNLPASAKRKSQKRADLATLCGPGGQNVTRAAQAAREFLNTHDTADLLTRVGHTISSVPKVKHLDKAVIQKSYYGGTTAPTDDLLAGKGPFYITEQRKLFLDCTSGHYQMTWGYDHPALTSTLIEGIQQGIVWDNHANVPQWPVKRLAQKLIVAANPDCAELRKGDFSKITRSRSRLNTVHLGVCTGSVACATALKITLVHYQKTKAAEGKPVIIALNGNYHGTNMIAQRLRGMWTEYVRNIEVVEVEPNDQRELVRAFSRYGRRIASFWAEPIMMNREVMLVERDYLRAARKLCNQADACMVIDEIQTGFWWPEVLMFHQFGVVPDILVVGKGLTAGFHPLAAILFKRRFDCLSQYDAINTNGNAALASLLALGCIDLIERQGKRIGDLAEHYSRRLQALADAYPERIAAIHGKGLMAGIKFRDVKDALSFHCRCVDNGLWVRAHAYHEGHSTVLTKLGLCFDKQTVDFLVDKLTELLEHT